eukprot:2614750-Karenia_brevis.AAC.1
MQQRMKSLHCNGDHMLPCPRPAKRMHMHACLLCACIQSLRAQAHAYMHVRNSNVHARVLMQARRREGFLHLETIPDNRKDTCCRRKGRGTRSVHGAAENTHRVLHSTLPR